MKRGNRSIWKAVLSSPFTLVAAVILVVFLGRAAWKMYERAGASSNKLAQASGELYKLKKQQSELSAQVSLLSTDEGIESELRTKYPAVKEGESVAIIIDNGSVASSEPATDTVKIKQASWWNSFLNTFGL